MSRIVVTSEGSIVKDNTKDEHTIKESQGDEEFVEGVPHDIGGKDEAGDGVQD